MSSMHLGEIIIDHKKNLETSFWLSLISEKQQSRFPDSSATRRKDWHMKTVTNGSFWKIPCLFRGKINSLKRRIA